MDAQPQAPDLTVIKERQQKAWSAGDYGKVGVRLLLIGELLCEAANLRPGERVLDVACGNGNTSLAAARRFCEITGVDYVPALLEEGQERAAAEGLEVDFREGDAENLPFPDASFDVALSTIGAMFAPNQEKVAGELLRVVRPGGRIGMANWTPEGFAGGLFKLMGKYASSPPGLKPPFLWGTEERLRELFGGGVAEMRIEPREFIFYYPSARYWAEFMRSNFGPLNKAFEALDEEGHRRLEDDLVELVESHNRSDDGTAVWPGSYLEVVATKR